MRIIKFLKHVGICIQKYPWVILGFIILLQVLMATYYFSQKHSLHIDETYTISQSVRHEPGEYYLYLAHRPDFHNIWHTDYFWNSLTIQEGEQFAFGTLFRWFRNVNHGPPLHHTTMHLVASFFPDTFSFWIGGSLSILWAVLTSILLYKTSLLVIKNPLLALLPNIIWSFSNAAMSFAVFIRFYAPAIFFFTLLCHLVIRLMTGKSKIDFKFCIALGATVTLGFLTTLHFAIILCLTAAALTLWLLYKRSFRKLLYCGITAAAFVGIIYLAMPDRFRAAFYHLEWHAGVVAEFSVIYRVIRVEHFLDNLNVFLFGGSMFPVAALIAMLLFIAVTNIASYDRETLRSTYVKHELPLLLIPITALLTLYYAHSNIVAIGGRLFLYAVLLAVVSIIVFVIFNISKADIKRFLSDDKFNVILFLVFIIVPFFILVSLWAPALGPMRNRYMIPIYPMIALLVILLPSRILPRISSKIIPIVLILVAVTILFSNLYNRNVLFLYPDNPNVSAIMAEEENTESLIIIYEAFGAGLHPYNVERIMYDFLHFDRTFISYPVCEEFNKEYLIDALRSINYGEGFYVLLAEGIDEDKIFNLMQQYLDFDDTLTLYHKFGLSMHRIVWDAG